jgi:CheY-like chemotaxis protein
MAKSRWNVLIAEDDLNYQQKLLDALKGRCSCVLASTGEEALIFFKQSHKKKKFFDFAILDVSMPKMDGFAVLRAIRALEDKNREKIKECSVIMITAYKDSLMEKYNMGWDEFVTKPIEKEKLLRRMEKLAEHKLE